MKLRHTDPKTRGEISFVRHEKNFDKRSLVNESKDQVLTIAWNSGEDQYVFIDEIKYTLPAWSILPLFSNQSFQFEKPEQITAWQYTRDFYCIADHDREVSCAGFLFFRSFGNLCIRIDEQHRRKLEILQNIFIEEFNTTDNIQSDMLQMLLKRLMIIITRLAKNQSVNDELYFHDRLDIVRQFNLLVDTHFKKHHQVQFYAGLMNRSPKTLSNLFAQHNQKSPLQVIHERIIMEAKRLFYYTDKSAKEIAYELGFEDAAHFSRFFKNITHQNSSSLKKAKETILV